MVSLGLRLGVLNLGQGGRGSYGHLGEDEWLEGENMKMNREKRCIFVFTNF